MVRPVVRSACSHGASARSTPRIGGITRSVSWRRARSIRADEPNASHDRPEPVLARAAV